MIRCLVIAIIVLFSSCNNGKNKPDVSHIKTDVEIERFEKSFFSLDTNNLAQGMAGLRNEFPRFYPVFFQDILLINPMDTANFPIIRQVISSYGGIYDSIQNKYKDLDWLEEDLEENFRFVKYYYPQYHLPKVITFLGTLDAPGVIMAPEYLGIGLQQFGGKTFSVYKDPAVQQLYPAYISRRFDKEYITANCMKAIADDIYPDKSAGKPLIEQMIEKGKSWYLLDKFLPDAPDSVKTGYTKQQLDWIEENEGNIWGAIIQNENLYTVEPVVIQTYLGEAPFTQGMSEASPGNLGQWVGWRIVQQFASKNPEITLQQILQTDAKAILEGAKYRPK
jgi:hypothetical protein